MNGLNTNNITQGEFATGCSEDQVITTILGSCVAACLWDPVANIGGMNHILLPDTSGGDGSFGSGVNAMELLINAITKRGAVKSRLKAKVFGGSKMISRLSDIGEQNAKFVIHFLHDEKIDCLAQSLGGDQPRRIQFWPYSGRARQKLLGPIEFPEELVAVVPDTKRSDIELF